VELNNFRSSILQKVMLSELVIKQKTKQRNCLINILVLRVWNFSSFNRVRLRETPSSKSEVQEIVKGVIEEISSRLISTCSNLIQVLNRTRNDPIVCIKDLGSVIAGHFFTSCEQGFFFFFLLFINQYNYQTIFYRKITWLQYITLVINRRDMLTKKLIIIPPSFLFICYVIEATYTFESSSNSIYWEQIKQFLMLHWVM